jgi:hypothetical protein
MDVVRTTLDEQGRKYQVPQPDTALFNAKTKRGTYLVVLIASRKLVSCACAPYKPVPVRSRRLLERWTGAEEWRIRFPNRRSHSCAASRRWTGSHGPQ